MQSSTWAVIGFVALVFIHAELRLRIKAARARHKPRGDVHHPSIFGHMVAWYFILFFAGLVEWRGSSARLVDDLSAGPDPLRASILEVLEREGVAIVRGSILFEPFPIRLGDGEPGHHTVFRVLFSDIDPLPASASGS